ncbi:MAG: helix-turn-helix domain-containing protein [Candidatus Acidiferrum sp.]
MFEHEAYSAYRVKRMNSIERFSIGELSKATGVKVVTIRYYEHVKLMPVPPRTEGNYRIYRREHLHRLQFVRRCRDLGFTLDQLRDLLRLSIQSGRRCSGIDRITKNHLREIEGKIADLQRLAVELRRIKNCCPGKGRIADCRILAALTPPDGKIGLRPCVNAELPQRTRVAPVSRV